MKLNCIRSSSSSSSMKLKSSRSGSGIAHTELVLAPMSWHQREQAHADWQGAVQTGISRSGLKLNCSSSSGSRRMLIGMQMFKLASQEAA
jgi:hypothetical protein